MEPLSLLLQHAVLLLLKPDNKICFVFKSDVDAKAAVNEVREIFINNLILSNNNKIQTSLKKSLIISNGSQFHTFTNPNPNALRGFSLNMFAVQQSIDNFDIFFQNSIPSLISTNGYYAIFK